MVVASTLASTSGRRAFIFARSYYLGASGCDLARDLESLFECGHLAVELLLVDPTQDFAHRRPRLDAEREQMPALDDRFRRRVLDAEGARALQEPLDARAVEASGSPQAVRARDAREQLEIDLLRQPSKRAVADRCRRLEERQRLQMVRDHAQHLVTHVVAADRLDVQAIEQRLRRLDSRLLVIH